MISKKVLLLLPDGTSGDAGSSATLPVSGSDIPLPGTKPEVVGIRNLGGFFSRT